MMFNIENFRNRQQRLAQVLQRLEVGGAVLIRPEHVQYFTGFRPVPVLQGVVVIFPDGKTLLSAPNHIPDIHAAHECVSYEAQWNCTLRQDQLTAAMKALEPLLPSNFLRNRIAIEFSANPAAVLQANHGAMGNNIDLEPELWRMRRCKDSDELALIEQAIACTEAMYARARSLVKPGLTELEIYNELHAAAVMTAQEPLLAVGNDFQCNSAGGTPRPRPVQQGELLILDLGVSYQGYYSDNCRTLSVGGPPSQEQQQAWEAVHRVLEFVEAEVRPGVSAKNLFQQARKQLDAHRPGSFFHHLGHGIGLSPHEMPHVNDCWDEYFEEGDVFTAEPGLYAPELKAGLRLEQDYLVTASGVKCLTSHPLDLYLG